MEIRDKKGTEILVVDHLSRLEKGEKPNEKDVQIDENFPDEQLFSIESDEKLAWFTDYVNYLVAKVVPLDMSWQQLKKFYLEVKRYYWDEPIPFHHYANQIIGRCVLEEEMISILTHYASAIVKSSDPCQRSGNISRRDQMSMTGIPKVELFDVWGIDFMGTFLSSYKNKYILLSVDYVSKWVLQQLLLVMVKRVHHQKALFYHPLTNGQAEVSNREIKSILEKTVELEHRAYWAVKKLNVDLFMAGHNRLMELNEHDEFRNEAYENARIYKEKSKAFHDKRILSKDFQLGDKVLLFYSRLKLFLGKLKSTWSGPYTVVVSLPYGAVKIHRKKIGHFKVNGQRLKHYLEGHVEKCKSVVLLEPF
ncbi:uncharacterized protein LOC133814898 [Humulus lupulus]|uniref:uncharacterized protein LOC133814898 n=1 Tax=Humulus lupulus TaxID=3486 RepID=UPI002B40334B|nr:uncharacterized protein LOC133814898 [Humulus lupulus]